MVASGVDDYHSDVDSIIEEVEEGKNISNGGDVKGTRADEGAGTDGWEKVENGSGPEEEKGSG